MIDVIEKLQRPTYLLEEQRLRNNLSLIQKVSQESGAEIILAFKAFALWKTFPIFKEYIQSTTASSLYEAELAYQEFGCHPHTFSPAYTAQDLPRIAEISSHLVFNSLSQYQQWGNQAQAINPSLSLGLRINPEYSEIETLLYNPCAPGSRFGVLSADIPQKLPANIEGFHCHCHCESGADVFVRTLKHIEEKFSPWFSQIKWINFGGGHLITRKDYDVNLMIQTLQSFHQRYPHLHIILEPGSAFAWQTGCLITHVVDIVQNNGIKTAILDISFTCHAPDCLEMPYHPTIRGAQTLANAIGTSQETLPYVYRLGGNSCLSGDFMGCWDFGRSLNIGETLILEDMIHYTTVKTTMFNGITHPDIAILTVDGRVETLKTYLYEDYRNRMD